MCGGQEKVVAEPLDFQFWVGSPVVLSKRLT